jgi:hypothetical protein
MAVRIPDFDIAQEGFAGATVTVYVAGTTTPANLFADEGATAALPNPQTLETLTIDDRSYGRFAQAVYVNQAYYLDIDTSEQTGVTRIPLLTLDGEDASDAVVTPTGRDRSRALADHLAQVVWAEDFGAFTGSASGNNTILQAAIGAAAAQGGGAVLLPAGTITFTQLTLPAGVVLVGKWPDVTTLQSVVASDVITCSGNDCGLMMLTLDGLSKQASSRGLFGDTRERIVLRDVKIKRFDRGILFQGLKHCRWRDLIVTDCNEGFVGNLSGDAKQIQFNDWAGGEISLCTTRGYFIDFGTLECSFNSIRGVKVSGNAVGILLDGARFTELADLVFDTNTQNLIYQNDSSASTSAFAKGSGLAIKGSRFDTGGVTVSGEAADAVFQGCGFFGVTFTLTTPRNAVKLENCTEDSTTTISGDGTKLVRGFENLEGFTRGVTTGNVATKAWSLKLDHGEMCTGIAKVTGKQRNGSHKAHYIFAFGAQRAPAQLAYDAQTANFTVGLILTGGTSGATARIIGDADGGVTGTLTLHSVSGAFIDNETITDSAGGSATANGALVAGSVSILNQASLSTSETLAAYNAVAAGTVEEVEVQVTGDTGNTVDWTVHVDAVRYG